MENLEPLHIHSENRAAMLDILDGLRAQVDRDEVLQLFVAAEDVSGGFSALWPGSEDRMAIAAFVIGSAFERMGFVRRPLDQS